MGSAGISLLVLAVAILPLLAAELRLGSAGARGGIIHRSECSVGYWIAIAGQAASGLSMLMIALAL